MNVAELELHAEQMLALRRENAQLRNDVEAQRKTLTRFGWERDQWRTRYLDLHERLVRLTSVQAEARNLRGDDDGHA